MNLRNLVQDSINISSEGFALGKLRWLRGTAVFLRESGFRAVNRVWGFPLGYSMNWGKLLDGFRGTDYWMDSGELSSYGKSFWNFK